MIKRLLQILIIGLPITSFGQSSNAKRIDLGSTNELPMRNAKVYYEEYYGRGCRFGNGLFFESQNDSVFSLCDGLVQGTIELGNKEVIVIKVSSERFYCYENLANSKVSKGDKVVKGAFLGFQVTNEEEGFVLMVADKKALYLPEDKIWQLIKDDSCNSVQVSDTSCITLLY